MMHEIVTYDYLHEHDEKGFYPYAVYDKCVEMGLLGLPLPEGNGGYGGDVIDMPLVSEELGRKAYPFFKAKRHA